LYEVSALMEQGRHYNGETKIALEVATLAVRWVKMLSQPCKTAGSNNSNRSSMSQPELQALAVPASIACVVSASTAACCFVYAAMCLKVLGVANVVWLHVQLCV
jgi:hypothetical protein